MKKRFRSRTPTVLSHTALFCVGLTVLLWTVVPAGAGAPADHTVQEHDPLAGVEDLILAGRPTEAHAAARQAERAFGLRGDRFHEALAVLVSAAAELSARDFAGAAADAKRSASALEKQGDRFSYWLALWHVGVLERALRQPSDAIVHLHRALVLLGDIETSPAPFSAESLKYLGRYLQMPPDILRLLSTRPEAVKSVLLTIAEAMTRRGTLDVLLDSGQIDEAEIELARLGELSTQLDGMFGDEVALYRGTLRRLQWRLDEAREIFQRALDKPNLASGREMEILDSLIELEVAGGRLDEALALTDRALTLARRRKNPSEEAKLLMYRAHILRHRQQAGSADEALAEAMLLAEKSGKTYEKALVLQQRGFLALDEGRPEQAAEYFEAAAGLFHALGHPEHEAHARIQLAMIYARLNSRASAADALAKAREIARESRSPLLESMTEVLSTMAGVDRGTSTMAELKDSLMSLLTLPQTQEVKSAQERERVAALITDLFQRSAGTGAKPGSAADPPGNEEEGFAGLLGVPRLLRGFAAYQSGDVKSARRLWHAALAERPRRDIEIVLLALLGSSFGKEGKDGEAIRYLSQAVAAVEQGAGEFRLKELLAGYLDNENQIVFADLIDLLARNGRTEEAFEYAESARARAFLQGLGNPRDMAPNSADAALLREAAKLRSQLFALERRAIGATAAERERLASDLRQAQEHYESLLVRLKVTSLSRTSHTTVKPLRTSQIREGISPDVSMVSYFVSSSRVHAWVLDRESFWYAALPLNPQDLRGAVCWASEVEQRGRGRGVRRLTSCGSTTANAEDLYQKLIAPLRGHLHHRRLILVPHGELHYLPFAALRDPQTRRYLVEDFTLTYAPSASVVGFLHARETPIEGRALVLGAPTGLDTSLRPLPAAQEEAKLVGRLFGVRPLLGRNATESRLYQLAGKVDLIHIAAHGFFEPRNPLFSHIALAPDEDNDGNLEAHEILSDLDLTGVNLVVLSACETARGERSRGDEIIGLTRAILDAGSSGVISTLWNIDDEAAAALMAEFYRHLLGGTPVAEALQQAQLALLHNPRYRDPGFWAAFSLAGDPQGTWRRIGGKEKP